MVREPDDRTGSAHAATVLSTVGFNERKKGVLKAGMTRPDLPAQLVQIPLGQNSAGDPHWRYGLPGFTILQGGCSHGQRHAAAD